MKKYFPASPDSSVWIVTGSLSGLLILLLALVGGITSLPNTAVIIMYSAAAVLAVVLLIGWLARPVRYDVRDTSVTIVRCWPFPSVTIPISEIREVRHLNVFTARPAGLVSLCVFGYAGTFRSAEVDEMLVVAARMTDAVLLVGRRNYVISPSNPKRFIRHISDLRGRK